MASASSSGPTRSNATLPVDHLRIEIEIVDENRRRFRVSPMGEKHETILKQLDWQ